MAFVQVKNTLQTWKLAAFIVAFFSSFFCGATDYSSLENKAAEVVTYDVYDCRHSYDNGIELLGTVVFSGDFKSAHSDCSSMASGAASAIISKQKAGDICFSGASKGASTWTGLAYKVELTFKKYVYPSCRDSSTSTSTILSNKTTQKVITCEDTEFNFQAESNGVESCFRTDDVAKLVDSEREDKNKDDSCKGLVLDSGNNTADNMCHTASSSGNSCNVQKVTSDGGGSYYKGVSASDGGCFVSEHPEYDDSGSGDDKDGCIYSEGTNYCEANRDKHCKVIQGSSICDDGCIDDGTSVFCDISKHPDVGEGDSDFFNDNGTCSVISASSSKGFCEDSGGIWDETQDYKETTCPVGAGTCSISVAGMCNACFDAGGTWTPDPNATLTTQEKVGIETTALIKDTNDKLTQIEHGQRKTMESLNSTVKSGSDKVVNAIQALGEKLGGSGGAITSGDEKEKESFTTTTENPDKSAFKSMFDASAQAAVKARVATAQTKFDSTMKSILAEAKTIFTVTVPTAVGYQVRNIQLSYGSVDASLSRYSDFFKTLSGPIMLLCSLIAALAILRD